MTTTAAAIRTERGKIYGDPQFNHGNIAMAWNALLRSRYGSDAPCLDAQMAELMLAAFKVVRGARPVPSDYAQRTSYLDSFPDAKNYLDFAAEAVEQESFAGARKVDEPALYPIVVGTVNWKNEEGL